MLRIYRVRREDFDTAHRKVDGIKMNIKGGIPIDHVSIGHHQPQRPVPRGFPLFKRYEWLVSKRRPPQKSHTV